MRKRLAAEKVFGKFLERAFDAVDGSLATEDHVALAAKDLNLDIPRTHFGFTRVDVDERTQRAGAVVDLRLRQIEKIFAFDIARTHVVADRVADDLAA